MEWEVRVIAGARSISRRRGYLILGMVMMVMPCVLSGQRGRAEVREANRLYDEGRFEEAHERYLDALRENPNSPLIRFNEGNALYQTDEFRRALDAYRQAVEAGDESLKSSAWYNLGNALYRQQQLQESAEAYKEALRLNPGDGDAKHNLELALQQLRQQQEQQQDQQRDQQQDQQQQQQQQQQHQEDEQEDREERQEQRQQDPQHEQDDQQQQQSREQPREMSREEAERLLQAIDEDPSEIDRQRARGRPPVRVRRDW